MLTKIVSSNTRVSSAEHTSNVQANQHLLNFALFMKELPQQIAALLVSILTLNFFIRLFTGTQIDVPDNPLAATTVRFQNQLNNTTQNFDNAIITNQSLKMILLFVLNQNNDNLSHTVFQNVDFNEFFNLKLESDILVKNFLYSADHESHAVGLAAPLKGNMMFRKLLLSLIKNSQENYRAVEAILNNEDISTSISSREPSADSIANSDSMRMLVLNSMTWSFSSDLNTLIHYFLFGSHEAAKAFVFSAMAYQIEHQKDSIDNVKATLFHNLLDHLLKDLLPEDLTGANQQLKLWFTPHFLSWTQSDVSDFSSKLGDMFSNKDLKIKQLILTELKRSFPAILNSPTIENYLEQETQLHFLLRHAPALLMNNDATLTHVAFDVSKAFFNDLVNQMNCSDSLKLEDLEYMADNNPLQLFSVTFNIARLMAPNGNDVGDALEVKYNSVMAAFLMSLMFQEQVIDESLLGTGKESCFWASLAIQDFHKMLFSVQNRDVFLTYIRDFFISQSIVSESKSSDPLLHFLQEHASNDFLRMASSSSPDFETLTTLLKKEIVDVLKARGETEKTYFDSLDLEPDQLLGHLQGSLKPICEAMVFKNFKEYFETNNTAILNELIQDQTDLLFELSSRLEQRDNVAFKTLLQGLFIDRLRRELNINNQLIETWLPYVPLPMLITTNFKQQLQSIQALKIKDMFKMPYSEHASYFKLAECVYSLDDEKQMMVRDHLKIGVMNDFISSTKIPDYIIHEMKIPQHILAKTLLHFHKINRKPLLEMALSDDSGLSAESIQLFSQQLTGQMPWSFFKAIVQSLGLTIGVDSDCDIVINQDSYYESNDSFDLPQPIQFDLAGKKRPSFFAIATGVLGLDNATKFRIFKMLNLNEYGYFANKPSYLFDELKMLQNLLSEAIFNYMKRNREIICFEACKLLEDELMRQHGEKDFTLNPDDLTPINNFKYDEIMPDHLFMALSKRLKLHVVINDPSTQIRIQKDGAKCTVEFPAHKIKSFEFDSSFDLLPFKISRFDQDMDLSQDVIENDTLTIDGMRTLYFNMLDKKHSKDKSIVPIFGVTQSGKTSLFNFILDIQKDLNFRVGGGVTSETALYYQLERDGVFYTDTPGLDDNRSNILEVLIHYQLFELLYSNQLSNIVITLKFSDLNNLSAGGNRSVIKFFRLFFNVKQLGDGFYDQVFEKYFGETHKMFFEDMIKNRLFNSKTDQIKSKWNLFFNEIESNVARLSEIPFTFVIRNDFGFYNGEIDVMDLIDSAIEKIKQDIVTNVIKNKGIMPTSLNNTLLLYLYYLFIKKDCVVANLDASNQDLLDSINQKKSVLNDLMYPIESIYNTNGAGPLFKEFFMSQISSQSKLIKDYFAFIENVELDLKNIQNLKLMVANITKKLEDSTNLLDTKDLDSINQDLATTENKISTYKDEKVDLERKLNEVDSDERMERDGWPDTKVAKGFLWKEALFFHEKAHKSDMILSKGSYSKVNRFDTEIQVQYPYFWQHWSDDYQVTCHNYTTKRTYYKIQIQEYKDQIERVRSALISLKRRLTTLEKLKETSHEKTKVNLTEELKLTKEKIEAQVKNFNEKLKSDAPTIFDRLRDEEDNIKLIYKILKNTDLNVMQHLLKNVDKTEYFRLVEQLMAHE
ncbi:MAG: hypothetical protein ACON35_02210 [Candidatus Marinamargulisbacteria bacterium]